jgi:DNA-binding LacI/PurR family transcriptional regulator
LQQGVARHLTQTAIRKSNGRNGFFTASHGARMLRESNPQITTVDQQMEMRGKVMADIVIKKIHGIDSPRTVMLPTELVVRQSA